jgi:hypothetical protein
MDNEDVRELLERTLTRLSDESKWRKDPFIVDGSACVVNTLALEAVAVVGDVGRAQADLAHAAEMVVLKAVPYNGFLSVPQWNDWHSTKHKDVIHVLQDAIKLVTSEDE